jgi:hypothetical protein
MPDPYLVNYLAEQDIECPGCGYNLRGLTGECCPECGQALVLRVGLAEPKMGAFVAGLIGLASGFGFNMFLAGWTLWAILVQGMGQIWWIFEMLIGSTVVLGFGMWLLVRGRDRLARFSRGCRLLWVCTCWVVATSSVMLFFFLVPL